MTILKVLWNTFRGAGLLTFLAVLFTVVLLVSCVAQIFLGGGSPGRAGTLHGGF